jgi:hypothetical protein
VNVTLAGRDTIAHFVSAVAIRSRDIHSSYDDVLVAGACPFGDDPLVENELDEIQLLRCDELGDTSTEFFLDFKGELTEKIDGTFTAAQLQASLEVREGGSFCARWS